MSIISSRINILELRKEFPILSTKMNGRPLIYLDSAATTHKPKEVIEAQAHFSLYENATVNRSIYELSTKATHRYYAARTAIAELINASEVNEIIFTKGTTEALNLLALSWGEMVLDQEDEVIVSALEHHANLIPWQRLCEKKKAKLRIIHVNDQGELDLDSYEQMLSNRTKIVSLTHISNVTGAINPIKQMTEMAKKFGATVCIDAAQSAGHLPIDVQDINCDFLAFSAHKMYGPTGIGILYGKKELLEKMPPLYSGGDMVEEVNFNEATFQEAPAKFEAGTPAIVEAIGFHQAIQFIQRVGLEEIATWKMKLTQKLVEKLKKLSFVELIGDPANRSSVVSFSIKDLHPLDIATLLNTKGIAIRSGHLCAQPLLKLFGKDQVARVSFGVYNTLEEVDLFIEYLQEAALFLQPSISY